MKYQCLSRLAICVIIVRRIFEFKKIFRRILRSTPHTVIKSIYPNIPARNNRLCGIENKKNGFLAYLESFCTVTLWRAVPWLRRLVPGFSPQRHGFDPVSVHVGFVMDKVALGQVFLRVVGFPLSVSFHRCSIIRKNEKKLIIFITGLHNKPQGCGASVAAAAGPYTEKKNSTKTYI
jgi:hypothetical protein